MKTKSSRISFNGVFQTYSRVGSSGTISGNSPSLSMVLVALPGVMSNVKTMRNSASLAGMGRFGIKRIG